MITLFNVVIATVRETAMKKLDSTSLTNAKRSRNYSQLQRSLSKFETAGSDPVAAALGLQSSNQAVCPGVLRRFVN